MLYLSVSIITHASDELHERRDVICFSARTHHDTIGKVQLHAPDCTALHPSSAEKTAVVVIELYWYDA
jgi:hypothetical protein